MDGCVTTGRDEIPRDLSIGLVNAQQAFIETITPRRTLSEPPDQPLPSQRLQRPLRAGQAVRIVVGLYRGMFGVVEERLTTSKQPDFITGWGNYAVRCADGRQRDYRRCELRTVKRERR